jgi:hypothetical protein
MAILYAGHRIPELIDKMTGALRRLSIIFYQQYRVLGRSSDLKLSASGEKRASFMLSDGLR